MIVTIHKSRKEDVEEKVKLLASICREFDCKVVIDACAKDNMDEETLEVSGEWMNYVVSLFKKYGIDCIGRTPNVFRNYPNGLYYSIWKEDEIRLYLFRHPEITHYCILDDGDYFLDFSDLNKVQDHLVKTLHYSDNPDEEGLLEKHRDEIGKVLRKENSISKLVLKYRK